MALVQPLQTSPALRKFFSAIKADWTKKQYVFLLEKYLAWKNCKEYDELLKDNSIQIQSDIENYIAKLRSENLSKTYIKQNAYSLILFFSMNDIILNTTKLYKITSAVQIQSHSLGNAYTDEQVRKILETIPTKQTPKNHIKHLRTKALVHLIASSGVRIGAIHNLSLWDLIPFKNTYALKVYANSKPDEYTAFITPQAKKVLDEYLSERFGKSDFLPRTPRPAKIEQNHDNFVFDLNHDNIRNLLLRLLRKAQVRNKVEGTSKYEIPLIHGFRKRFNTILKNNKEINISAIEKLMGHSTTVQLDNSYYKPTLDQLFTEYEKGIEGLEIR